MEVGRRRHTITVMLHWLYFMTIPDEGFRNATPQGLRAGQILSHITDGIPGNERDIHAKGVPIGSETGTGPGASAVIYYSGDTVTDALCAAYSVGAAGVHP